MGWQEQNEQQWLKIDFVLQGGTTSDVMWITCDQYQHRQVLFQHFQDRFPRYRHTAGKVDGFQGGSLPAYLLEVFEQQGGAATGDQPQAFHVTGLERYLSFADDKGKGGFLEALNFERPLFYQDLPFLLVFWTDSHALIKTHRLSADFWEWLSKKFHFEGPEDQLDPAVELNLWLDCLYKEQPSPEETELLRNRNARLLARLESAKRAEDRISLWIDLADNCFKLREFPESIRYRRLVLDHLPENLPGDRTFHLHQLANTMIWGGEKHAASGNVAAASAQFEQAIAVSSEAGSELFRANAMIGLAGLEARLGNLDSARALYGEAIDHFKAVQDRLRMANAMIGLADLETRLGNLGSARALYGEAIDHFKAVQDRLGMANVLSGLARLEIPFGNLDNARALYREAIDHYKAVNYRPALATSLTDLADLEDRLGNLDNARALYGEAIDHFKAIQAPEVLAFALTDFAYLEVRLGNLDSARALYEEAMRHYKAMQYGRGLTYVILKLGLLMTRGLQLIEKASQTFEKLYKTLKSWLRRLSASRRS
jgi:tetratricopeptide (TPR) repeat protein